jgi:ketosteroid isomerase-like protein
VDLPEDLADLQRAYHDSVAAFISGDADPQKQLWSRADDATLANPFGPAARGWDAIVAVMQTAMALVHDGRLVSVVPVSTVVTTDLAYTVAYEHSQVLLGDSTVPKETSLRVTTIFRRETDGWKIVHRHADPITEPRSVEAVLR